MKQKIVMKVQMNCQKCRSKALKVAADNNGVNSVSIEGEEKELVVIIGEGVDPVKLTSSMRKKVGYTYLVGVNEVKPNEEKEEKKIEVLGSPQWMSSYQSYPQFVICETVYDRDPLLCSIM